MGVAESRPPDTPPAISRYVHQQEVAWDVKQLGLEPGTQKRDACTPSHMLTFPSTHPGVCFILEQKNIATMNVNLPKISVCVHLTFQSVCRSGNK